MSENDKIDAIIRDYNESPLFTDDLETCVCGSYDKGECEQCDKEQPNQLKGETK